MLKNSDLVSSVNREWKGRFPKNEIISLLDVNRRLNLAESTSQDFHFGELLDLVGYDRVKDIRLGYGSAQGTKSLCDEVASMYGITSDCIVSTQGTALALYLLSVELCRPGDEAVIFTPCFPPSRDAMVGSGVSLIEVPLKFEDGYQVNLEEFAANLTAETKLVSLATPQNPAGVATSQDTILKMLDVMTRVAPGAFLFIDETYANATYGNAEPPTSFAGLHPRIITGGSVSKAFGAPGLRVGWMTTSDPELRSRLVTAKMNMVISGSPLNETLAALILRNRGAVLGPRRVMLGEAINLVADWQARNTSRVSWIRPDGGAMCCLRLKEEAFSDQAVQEFWQVLPELDLQLASGSWFGETSRVFRLGFGYLPLDTLVEALQNLETALISKGSTS